MSATAAGHINLADYQPVVGRATVDQLRILARPLAKVTVQHINSTFIGGGVAEILGRMIPLLQDVGVPATWDVIQGNGLLFSVTKKLHNALHGRGEDLTEEDIAVYMEALQHNVQSMDLTGDIVFVHDPQPAGLVQKKGQLGKKWLWRCHIDVSQPRMRAWNFLEQLVTQYDAAIFPPLPSPAPFPSGSFSLHPLLTRCP